MRGTLRIIVVIACLAGFNASRAIVPDQTKGVYQAIPERNVFGLKPPPSQPAPTNSAAPLPKIILTGIATILDSKRALMKVAPAGAKQVDPAKEVSLMLSEGQREENIEVLQIDEQRGAVKVNNSGTVMVLTFEKDGAKLPATPPPAALPGMIPAGHPPALPGTATATNPAGFPVHQGMANLPSRGTRAGMPPLPGAGSPSPVGGVPSATGPGVSATQPSPAATAQDLTAEEQAIIAEFQAQTNASNPALLPSNSHITAPVQTQSPAAVTPGGAIPAAPVNPLTLVPQ